MAKKVLDDEQNFILRELEVDSLICLEESIANKKITLEQTAARVEVLKISAKSSSCRCGGSS